MDTLLVSVGLDCVGWALERRLRLLCLRAASRGTFSLVNYNHYPYAVAGLCVDRANSGQYRDWFSRIVPYTALRLVGEFDRLLLVVGHVFGRRIGWKILWVGHIALWGYCVQFLVFHFHCRCRYCLVLDLRRWRRLLLIIGGHLLRLVLSLRVPLLNSTEAEVQLNSKELA